MSTPRRYRFDNETPVYGAAHLPVQRPAPLPVQPSAVVGEMTTTGQVPQVVHVHQAPPDRTLQRVALGAGVGGGAVAAGVVYGPLLVAAFTSIAITLLVLALAVAVLTWGIVTVVGAVGGGKGKGKR
jgi:hypothetical protein